MHGTGLMCNNRKKTFLNKVNLNFNIKRCSREIEKERKENRKYINHISRFN